MLTQDQIDEWDVDDLSETDLSEMQAYCSTTLDDEFSKNDFISVLTRCGCPEWQHGKRYAKQFTGRVLDMMSRAGLVEKAGSGLWRVI